jgi:hypothetical protein
LIPAKGYDTRNSNPCHVGKYSLHRRTLKFVLNYSPQIARITEQDMKVSGGYTIPQGSIVFCHHRLAALQVTML